MIGTVKVGFVPIPITVGYGRTRSGGLSLDVLQGELTVIVGPDTCSQSALCCELLPACSARCGIR